MGYQITVTISCTETGMVTDNVAFDDVENLSQFIEVADETVYETLAESLEKAANDMINPEDEDDD